MYLWKNIFQKSIFESVFLQCIFPKCIFKIFWKVYFLTCTLGHILLRRSWLDPQLLQLFGALTSSKLCEFIAIKKKPLKTFWEFWVHVFYSKMVIRDCRKTPGLLAACLRKETELLVTPPSITIFTSGIHKFSQVQVSNTVIVKIGQTLNYLSHTRYLLIHTEVMNNSFYLTVRVFICIFLFNQINR